MLVKYEIGPSKITKKELQVLKVLAKNKRPLSSREIEKEIIKQHGVKGKEREKSASNGIGENGRKKRYQDRDVYRAIKDKLCIQKFKYEFFLFDWNELLSSIDRLKEDTTFKKRIQGRVIDRLNIIGLDLVDYDYNKTEIEDHDSEITIAAPKRSKPAVTRLVKIKTESKDYAILTIFENDEKLGEVPLITKKVGKKERQVFYVGIRGHPFNRGISYLNVSLNGRASKTVERIKSMNPDLFNCTDEVKLIPRKCLLSGIEDSTLTAWVSQIESKRKNWEYGLKTRGLIHCILGMIDEESKEGNNRVRNVELSTILENLAENYKLEFPYLRYYKEIKKLYDSLPDEYRLFHVKLMKQIALELRYSLNTIDDEELEYYVTKCCSDALTWRYLTPMISISSPPRVIQDYYLYTQQLIKNYLENELWKTRERIEYIMEENQNI